MTQIKSVKGFDSNLSCRGFQFEVGQSYSVKGKIKACENGFHACQNPFDVWRYYPVVDGDGKLARYAEVEQSGSMDRDGDKIASAEITVKAELSLPAFVRKAVQAVVDLTKDRDESGNDAQIGSSGYGAQIGSSGNGAQIGSSGYGARIGSSGNGAQIGSSGYGAQIGSSGNDAQIGSSGYDARIGSSGYGARIGSSGNGAQIGSSGNDARIGSSGNGAQIGSSGNDARIVATGTDAVVASAGANTTFSGEEGSWVSLAEYVEGKCVGFATGQIGKDGLRPGVQYRARGGKLVEVGQ